MTEDEVFTKLGDILAEIFQRNDIPVGPNLNAKDVEGWDSHKQIELLISTEERFGLRFRTKEIDALHNLGDLARLVLSRVNV